ncbi:hypothetical protein BDV96DRAFT_640666 [Lophiotrema nucula]|uniref:Uncharacterized protein n=1 Tax=Lophiotrema nucula TaxID=690887 RepID=A0A6A5ZNL2_9PLEO|nr:hypothetical protein BDV96DRAFT_640666 [Lophiotrema nucula]
MSTRSPSPPSLPQVPQNTPYSSRPTTSHAPKNPLDSLPSIVNALLPKGNLIYSQPSKSNPTVNAAISSLQLHPTLEAALHILNQDLPSAHFLVRKMEAPPAVEGMLLHSILHRIEGDFPNSRAWMSDVGDACEGWVPKRRGQETLSKGVKEGMMNKGVKESLVLFVYTSEEEPLQLIDDVEKIRKGEGREKVEEIEELARTELERVINWCRNKFGEGSWVDATEAYTKGGEEVQQIHEEMISGDKGWRKF